MPISRARQLSKINIDEYVSSSEISQLENNVTNLVEQSFTVALSDEATALTSGTSKLSMRAPHAMTIIAIPTASLTTASSSGLVTIDINVSGVSILSTKLTIDANERTSTTAATAAVLSTTSIASDAEITFDIDGAGTSAAGLKVTLYYKKA